MPKGQPGRRPGRGAGPVVHHDAFVGREAERRAIDDALDAGRRVVTLVGLGGMGKTRLACEVLRARPDTSVFCDLTEASSAPDVAEALARALEVRLVGGGDLSAEVGDRLAARGDLLVVLDNAEGAVGVVAASVGGWLEQAPHARFLVTSREVLRLRGETVHELPPLAVPAEGEAAHGADAVRLLAARVDQIRPGLGLLDGDAAGIAAVARHLEGIPLALELAAPRIATLGTQVVLDLLERRTDLLTRGAVDLPPRHATMRAALAWSWELLDAEERAVLARCAVFRGGFSLAAAAACLAGPGESPGAVADVLQRLVEKSMIRVLHPGGGGAPRFDLFVAVRELAAERLAAAGEVDLVEARHVAFFVDAGESACARCDGPDGAAALAWLRAERDNLVAVVERSRAAIPPRVADATRALLALTPLVLHHGGLGSHLARWDAVLAAPPDAAMTPDLVARARLGRGRLRVRAGALTGARDDLGTAAALAEEHGDRATAGRASIELAGALHLLGDTDRAHEVLDRAITSLRDAGDLLREGLAHRARGMLLTEQSRASEAVDSFERALAALGAAGGVRFVASTRVNLAIARIACGRRALARRDLEESLALCARGDGLRGTEGAALGALALLLHLDGDRDGAAPRYDAAVERARELGDSRFEGVYRGHRALLAAERGDDRAAVTELGEAVVILRRAGDGTYAALFASFAALLAGDEVAIAEAIAALEDVATGHLVDVAAIQRAHAEALALRRAPDAARRARVAAALDAVGGDVARTAGGAADLLLASRLARRALGPGEDEPGALVVSATGRWFRTPAGATGDCANHPTLRRALLSLAHAAVDRPGVVVTAAALMAAVWPDERATAASRNRLKTLIARLRRMGLAELLRTDPDGYLLDRAIAVRVVEDPPTAVSPPSYRGVRRSPGGRA